MGGVEAGALHLLLGVVTRDSLRRAFQRLHEDIQGGRMQATGQATQAIWRPANIVEQLQRDEGYKQFPYRDSKGVLTIGYGFNLEGVGLSRMESQGVLRERAVSVATEISSRLPWTDKMDPIRRAVLVNMGYNMGVDKLLLFHTFLGLCQAGKWDEAADDDLHTLWASEVGDRAKRLALQLRTGEWK